MVPNDLKKKVLQPDLLLTTLQRERLVTSLQAALDQKEQAIKSTNCKLFLLCAPAGYGKTTLLVDFAHHSNLPCCWYFLDHTDTSLTSFLQTLILSIRQRFLDFGQSAEEQLLAITSTHEAQLQPYEKVMEAIALSIEKEISEQLLIFLCNYQEVNHQSTFNVLVDRFLHFLPDHCTLVIESRAMPKLQLASLISRRQIQGFGRNKLRFTGQDIQDLAPLLDTETLTAEEAERLSDSFDGWITGLLLGTQLGNIQDLVLNNNTKTHTNMNQNGILAYLANDVFHREPDTYMFLRDLSILESITPAYCNLLLSISDGQTRLHHLEKQGFFLERSSREMPIYAIHPIVRKLCYTELQYQEPERFRQLHSRAADIFLEEQNYEDAIAHGLAANLVDFVAETILKVAKSAQHQEHNEKIARWIDALPSSALHAHPQLLLSRTQLHLIHYETEQALTLLERAGAVISQTQADENLTAMLQAEHAIISSVIVFDSGDYKKAQELCLHALQILPAKERELRAMACQRLGICACVLGECQKGIGLLQQALQLWGLKVETRQIALLHSHLANAYNLIGNYTLSEYHRSRAIHSFWHSEDMQGMLQNMIGMATIKLNKGDRQGAEEVFLQVVTQARQYHLPNSEAYALANLGELYLNQGNYRKALTAIEDGLALARELNDTYLINFAIHILAFTYASVGDLHTALILTEQIKVKVDHTSYDGSILKLTKGTIFFYLHRFEDACIVLSEALAELQSSDLHAFKLRATIRLAACQQARQNVRDTVALMGQAVALTRQGYDESVALAELQRFPELYEFTRMLPGEANLIVRCLPEQHAKNKESSPQPVPEACEDSAPHSIGERERAEKVSEKHLRIQALGEPLIIINDEPITHWRMAKSAELFFFLLNYQRPIRKGQLLVTLWPEDDDDQRADQNLRAAIYHLRKVMGKDILIHTNGQYILNLEASYGTNVSYDVAHFLELDQKATACLEEQDDETAYQLFQQMTALYHGDYVQSFYGDWYRDRREELRYAYIKARNQLASIAWKREQVEESIKHWQHLLSVESCFEEAHYGLMRCFFYQKKRELALRQYQRCVDILQKELGTLPGRQIQKLYQHLTALPQ
jgi:LuxR family transcriptional regulator, maltose regulon positive regulatory protein